MKTDLMLNTDSSNSFDVAHVLRVKRKYSITMILMTAATREELTKI